MTIEAAREALLHDIELYVRRRDNCSGYSGDRWQKGIQHWRVTRAADTAIKAAALKAETERDEVARLLHEERHWSVVIRALDSWHEINLQDSKCECPAHRRIEKLRTDLLEHEALAQQYIEGGQS